MIAYDQKIEFYSISNVSDGYGGVTNSDKLELSTFAKITQMKQPRTIDVAQLSFPSVFAVEIQKRKNFEPTTAMFVKWRGENYNIISEPTTDDVRMGRTITFNIRKTV